MESSSIQKHWIYGEDYFTRDSKEDMQKNIIHGMQETEGKKIDSLQNFTINSRAGRIVRNIFSFAFSSRKKKIEWIYR